MNQTSTKSPIAAATLEIISARFAKLSTLKRSPDEKPNTLVSTLCYSYISLRCRKHYPEEDTHAAMESNCGRNKLLHFMGRMCLLMRLYSTTHVLA